MALKSPDFSYREKDGIILYVKSFPFKVGHLDIALNTTMSLSFQHFRVHNTQIYKYIKLKKASAIKKSNKSPYKSNVHVYHEQKI